MNTYIAKHNHRAHTVTIHSANCTCAASGSIWLIGATSAEQAVEFAKEDAPNVKVFNIAPCAKDVCSSLNTSLPK